LEFMDMFDGNLPSVMAIGAVMLVGTIGSALISNGYLSKALKGRGKGKTLAELAARVEGVEKGFVPDLGDALRQICGKLDAVHGQMIEMERRLNYADKSALMGVIHNEKIHRTDRLRAFNNYLKLGGNGTVCEYAVAELVMPSRDCWTRVLDESRMEIRCDKYRERIAEIDRRLRGETA